MAEAEVKYVTRKFVIEVEIPEDKDLIEMADELLEFLMWEGEHPEHPFPQGINVISGLDPVHE